MKAISNLREKTQIPQRPGGIEKDRQRKLALKTTELNIFKENYLKTGDKWRVIL